MTTKKSKGSSAARFMEKILGGPLRYGAAIRAMRELEEVSQAVFAKKLGISKAHLCDIEKGRRSVSADRAAQFALRMGHPQAYWVKLAIQDQLNRTGLKLRVEIKAA